jgi:hypothetical protein
VSAAGPIAFVIMPFAEEFLGGFQDVIEPAVEQAGLRCVRADQQPQGHIQSQMFDQIFDAAVVVADISGVNPNVFYELGVAHCLGSRTVTLAREDYIDRVPFDIAPYRVLVYPRAPPGSSPESDHVVYRGHAAEARDQLALELGVFAKGATAGVTNPVQDYLAARSPLTSAQTRYLAAFTSDLEEELLRHTESELTHVSLTGAGFIGLLAGHVENDRSASLKVNVLLLNPDDQAGWAYVFHLREGRPASESEFKLFMDENRAVQSRTRSMIEQLNRFESFSGGTALYSGIPTIWAYAVDRRRLVVGHLALTRLGARNLPVAVVVKEDPKTRPLFDYYLAVIDSLGNPGS